MATKIIVGSGIAGLTAAAYLSQYGYSVLLLEKSDKTGGLIGSFKQKGFVFDYGIRAIENSGTIFPMLRQLGIPVDFKKNKVSIGIENELISFSASKDLHAYQELLAGLFPDEENQIRLIVRQIHQVSEYMNVLYGVENPLFLDMKTDYPYYLKTILPWTFKYFITARKINTLNKPVNDFLNKITKNQALIDMVTQHYFSNTPVFFALSYFRIYNDYYYPTGGTGSLTKALENYIVNHGGIIKTGCEINHIDVKGQKVFDSNNNSYFYSHLVWAGDLKSLYRSVSGYNQSLNISEDRFLHKKNTVLSGTPNESVYTLYLCVDLPPAFFADITTEHTFYTPVKEGLHSMDVHFTEMTDFFRAYNYECLKSGIISWLEEFTLKTTYEISVPVLRDTSLAPEEQTGLIISTLFDYDFMVFLKEKSLYKWFKNLMNERIVNVLDNYFLKGMKKYVLDSFSSTPLTYYERLGNSKGAITGWSFSDEIPVENKMQKIAKAVKTPFEHIYQAGHWTFSPSGMPTAAITGKLAADKIRGSD
jgi:phytoene dehydrogenase-like protein